MKGQPSNKKQKKTWSWSTQWLASIAEAYRHPEKQIHSSPPSSFPAKSSLSRELRTDAETKCPVCLGLPSILSDHDMENKADQVEWMISVAPAQSHSPVSEKDLKNLELFIRNRCGPFIWLNLLLQQGLGKKAAAGNQ